MEKKKVLFVCRHNSARSQMAEAYLNKFGGERFAAESAGIEPGVINPMAVEAMRQDGIDISGNKTKNVFEFFNEGRNFDYVITVCDVKSAEFCPVFPGAVSQLRWMFDDPAEFKGAETDRLEMTVKVRDEIKEMVTAFVKRENTKGETK
jgi:arsenate reductase (thioredoxin)